MSDYLTKPVSSADLYWRPDVLAERVSEDGLHWIESPRQGHVVRGVSSGCAP
jgi:hypothetical protein